MSSALYHDISEEAAEKLRLAQERDLIAPGRVVQGDIRNLRSQDLRGVSQVHFFAGLGAWSAALRLAGVPDDAELWSGSAPCQPFSVAGKKKGTDDHRHLWPIWKRLIAQCRPPVLFGEQVASPDGLAWLSVVQADLEALGYAVGAADLCAAGVGAPHLRQRLFFGACLEDSPAPTRQGARDSRGVADSGSGLLEGHGQRYGQQKLWSEGRELRRDAGRRGGVGRMADGDMQRQQPAAVAARGRDVGGGGARGVADGQRGRLAIGQHLRGETRGGPQEPERGVLLHSWSQVEWVLCRSPRGPKWRPVEPGLEPLAHGARSLGDIRLAGNAIVPEVAAEFIGAFLDSMEEL